MTAPALDPDFDERTAFALALQQLFGDGVRLKLKLARDELLGEVFDGRVLRLHRRLHAMADAPTADDELRKLKKRLTPSETRLTFVEVAGVDPTNNKAEREVRPAVLMRMVSQGSVSEPGAEMVLAGRQVPAVAEVANRDKTGTRPLESGGGLAETLENQASAKSLPLPSPMLRFGVTEPTATPKQSFGWVRDTAEPCHEGWCKLHKPCRL